MCHFRSVSQALGRFAPTPRRVACYFCGLPALVGHINLFTLVYASWADLERYLLYSRASGHPSTGWPLLDRTPVLAGSVRGGSNVLRLRPRHAGPVLVHPDVSVRARATQHTRG